MCSILGGNSSMSEIDRLIKLIKELLTDCDDIELLYLIQSLLSVKC